MNEDMSKIKNTLKLIPKFQTLKKQKDDLYKEYKVVRQKGRDISKKIDAEKSEINKLKQKMEENKQQEAQEKEEKE